MHKALSGLVMLGAVLGLVSLPAAGSTLPTLTTSQLTSQAVMAELAGRATAIDRLVWGDPEVAHLLIGVGVDSAGLFAAVDREPTPAQRAKLAVHWATILGTQPLRLAVLPRPMALDPADQAASVVPAAPAVPADATPNFTG